MEYQDHSSVLELTLEQKDLMEKQNSRMVSEFISNKVERECKKHWDLFYKRNENKFFKDRHWTTREFEELVGGKGEGVLLEVGCGVGNLLLPLVSGGGWQGKAYGCDLSPRAVDLASSDPRAGHLNLFQADVTEAGSLSCMPPVDVCTLVFVLSAIHPDKFHSALVNIRSVLKPGGVLLFRDYGLHDMTQLRFKPGHKIADNFYLRQDGTRSYFFSLDRVKEIFTSAGFEMVSNCYVHRRTVNIKEEIDVPRIFVQTKVIKPVNAE